MEEMDKETRKILDILSENEFSLAENIAIIAKVLAILLAVEQSRASNEEEREILRKAREKIAQYIINGE
jgi:deoxyxylulose-5-phosphate synthase